MTTKHPTNGRGCGDRKPNSSYLCTSISIHGSKTVEDFIIDPPLLWTRQEEWNRGYNLLKTPDGYYNVGIFIGKGFYPSPWDFIEETRNFGISRRIPNNFPFEKLTPGKSKMIFYHAKAYPNFWYKVDKKYPEEYCRVQDPKDEPCTFDLRHLAYLHHPEATLVEEDIFQVTMPSFSYYGVKPYEVTGKAEFLIAAFFASPITHVEYYKEAHEKASKNAQKAGYDTFVLNW